MKSFRCVSVERVGEAPTRFLDKFETLFIKS